MVFHHGPRTNLAGCAAPGSAGFRCESHALLRLGAAERQITTTTQKLNKHRGIDHDDDFITSNRDVEDWYTRC